MMMMMIYQVEAAIPFMMIMTVRMMLMTTDADAINTSTDSVGDDYNDDDDNGGCY